MAGNAVLMEPMLLWILALILVAAVGLVGFYQGALRASVSLLGLLTACLTARLVGKLFNLILPALGLTHPAVLDFVSPVLGFILVSTLFKLGGFALHKKVDTWFKYRASDTQRLLWERLNSRLGISVGIANGVIYVFALATLIYTFGYFSYQTATHRDDSWILKSINRLAGDIQSTGMNKSIAPFNPATDTYFDSSDILADLFHSPLLQNRLANYPIFLTLGDQQELKGFSDAKFQEKWASGISLREFSNHEVVKPVLENVPLFTNVLGLVKPDLKDLKSYLSTGVSPKYDEEKILGRWQFNFRASLGEARKRKPTMGSAELKKLRALLGTAFNNASLVATVDNKAMLKLPGRSRQGTWTSAGGGQYLIRDSASKTDAQATSDGKRMTVVLEGIALVFDNTRV